ncbi:hypothetical protein NQZ68_029080 [Dissostichus eleginoides]|nr:hypothetical protein NQZ68_029080 [Dissostichus eleginoides]
MKLQRRRLQFQDCSPGTALLGPHSWDRTPGTALLGPHSWDRTPRTLGFYSEGRGIPGVLQLELFSGD